jgi:segregation and condensation protein A
MLGDAFRLALPTFEGPLDLLLHLIREHKLDIFDIPIALITEKYLESLASMRLIDLDIAGEFLVMASTLAHIKSRLLLPKPESQGDAEPEDQGDPRAELVRRLLEYQKYREAAQSLLGRPILDRDVFARRATPERNAIPDDELGLVEVSVFKLIEALDQVIRNAAPEIQHQITRDQVSISDAIHAVAECLRRERQVSFAALFVGQSSRTRIIATFLAILEMCRLKLILIFQGENEGDILLTARGDSLAQVNPLEVDESEYR